MVFSYSFFLQIRPEDKGRLLYVGNIPFRSAWQDIKDLFREVSESTSCVILRDQRDVHFFQAGEVIRVDIPYGRDGRQRGFATVLYEKEEDAAKAIQLFNETEFNGRKLMVREDQFASKNADDREDEEDS